MYSARRYDYCSIIVQYKYILANIPQGNMY